MKTSLKNMMSTELRTVLLGIAALFAGIVNGFLGTGGGIVLMFALSLLPDGGEAAQRDRFATVIAVILPLSFVSVVAYGNSLNMELATSYIIPGIIGGVLGAFLLERINVNFLKRLFAVMVLWAGISFLR